MTRFATALLAAGFVLAGAASAQDSASPPIASTPPAAPAPSDVPASSTSTPSMPAPSVMPTPPAASVPPPVAPPTASAPEVAPDAADHRYSFHRVQDNFVRLDSRTGQVSVCGRETAGWACRAVPDERTALEEAIGRLQGDNAALKKELLARGLQLPSGVKPDASVAAKDGDKTPDKPGQASPSLKTPSDAELDRVLAFIEKVWRRLVEMMVDFQRDIQRKS